MELILSTPVIADSPTLPIQLASGQATEVSSRLSSRSRFLHELSAKLANLALPGSDIVCLTGYFSLPWAFNPSLKEARTNSTLAGLALYPMRPTLHTLPALPPSPPEISTLYLSIASLMIALQSTPSGICSTADCTCDHRALSTLAKE